MIFFVLFTCDIPSVVIFGLDTLSNVVAKTRFLFVDGLKSAPVILLLVSFLSSYLMYLPNHVTQSLLICTFCLRWSVWLLSNVQFYFK